LRSTIGENVRLALEVSSPQSWARTDANQLESAVLNLAINARDAMPDGGIVTIATTRRTLTHPPDGLPAGDYVLVSVKDTGVGMAPDIAARAFDPFFTTKPIGVGTGLGLSMVHGFVNQSGGAVRIETSPETGTEIILYLPAADNIAVQTDRVDDDKLENGFVAGKTVLVVEDEPLVRMLIVDVLSDLGFTAVEARSAEEALREIDTGRRIDLLLSDVGLPGLNGRQLAEIARKRRPKLKVLFLTGYAEHAMRRSEFLGPGMDMMVKPFEVGKLSAKIAEIVSGP
jgi:CheY-like chemotaxis protein